MTMSAHHVGVEDAMHSKSIGGLFKLACKVVQPTAKGLSEAAEENMKGAHRRASRRRALKITSLRNTARKLLADQVCFYRHSPFVPLAHICSILDLWNHCAALCPCASLLAIECGGRGFVTGTRSNLNTLADRHTASSTHDDLAQRPTQY